MIGCPRGAAATLAGTDPRMVRRVHVCRVGSGAHHLLHLLYFFILPVSIPYCQSPDDEVLERAHFPDLTRQPATRRAMVDIVVDDGTGKKVRQQGLRGMWSALQAPAQQQQPAPVPAVPPPDPAPAGPAYVEPADRLADPPADDGSSGSDYAPAPSSATSPRGSWYWAGSPGIPRRPLGSRCWWIAVPVPAPRRQDQLCFFTRSWFF